MTAADIVLKGFDVSTSWSKEKILVNWHGVYSFETGRCFAGSWRSGDT
jgi:hypothetical protein